MAKKTFKVDRTTRDSDFLIHATKSWTRNIELDLGDAMELLYELGSRLEKQERLLARVLSKVCICDNLCGPPDASHCRGSCGCLKCHNEHVDFGNCSE